MQVKFYFDKIMQVFFFFEGKIMQVKLISIINLIYIYRYCKKDLHLRQMILSARVKLLHINYIEYIHFFFERINKFIFYNMFFFNFFF